MTTLRAAARAARDRLLATGVAEDEVEAEIEAEVLLRHAMDPVREVSKSYLYARFEDQIDPAVSECFDAFLAQRLARQPTAYIIGHREFCGLDLRLTPDVLIPRPETELLVESVIELAQADPRRPRLRIADVGTGSGAIAVALAKALPRAEVYATDVSRPALAIAAENARWHGVQGRIAFRAGHLVTPLQDYVDFIVANLPYVTTRDWTRLEPELREHEPRLALDGGPDGLDLIRGLLRQAFRYLRPGGHVLIEVGEGQAETIATFLGQITPLQIDLRTVADFRRVPRVLVMTDIS